MIEVDESYVELATQQQNPGYSNSGIKPGSNMGASATTGVFIPPPKKKDLNSEVGVTFSYPFSTQYHNLWELWKTDKVTTVQLEVMRRTDGHARALYNLLTLPIRTALKTATIQPMIGEVGGTEEAAFINMMLNLPPAAGGMVVPLNQFIAQMLLGVFHGFSVFEMVYWVPKNGPLAGKYTLKKASYRPADTVRFLTNDQGEFGGMRQRTFQHGQYIDVALPKETALLYTCNAAESPFYGVSMFEAAFWHYDKKVKLYYLAHLAAQKGAIGTRIGHMPPSPIKADKDSFLRQLSQLGVQQYMAMPLDWDVTVLQETGKFDFLPMIEHHNHMMSESVLASFFDGNSTGSAQPQVDFSTQDDTLFIQLLETIMDDIADVINNQLIPRFIDWNFGTGMYPKFKWGPFTDEQKDAIRLTFNQIAMAGQNMNMDPKLWQALQLKWAQELGVNVDFDALQKDFDQQNEQTEVSTDQANQLANLTFQTQLVQTHNALEEAVNPTPVPVVAPGSSAPAVAAPPVVTAPAAKKTTPARKIAAAQKVAAASHPAAKKAAAVAKTATAKQNSGNPNPNPGPKPLSPKSPAQKKAAVAKERARGH